jgi:hypothetical protein
MHGTSAPAEGAPVASAPPLTPAAPGPGPAASPPPTPLEQRQWRRAAQTTLRLALTSAKAARARSAEASAAGTGALTDLTNAALDACYLPARPLGALSEAPGLVEAAAAKLRTRQAAALGRLEASCCRLEAAAQVRGYEGGGGVRGG